MIPKVIHYCWLSNDPLPAEARECLKSWRKIHPDYKIKLWNMSNFDISSVPFVQDAVNARKWAFACDYIRCYALYTEGGIYFDSDVFLRKPIDFVLGDRAFSAIESNPTLVEKIKQENLIDGNGDKRDPNSSIHGIQIQAAILGAEKGHPFFKDCLEFYNNLQFSTMDNGIPAEYMISPIIMANLAIKYGFKFKTEEQLLAEGFHLYPSDLFAPNPWMMEPESVAVHCCNGSWRSTMTPFDRIKYSIKERVKVALHLFGRKEKNIENLRCR